MKRQNGYYNIDFGGMIVALLVFGIIGGIVVWEAVKWLVSLTWPFVKVWLHTFTA